MSEQKYKNGREAKKDDQVFYPVAGDKLETGQVTGIESDGIVVELNGAKTKIEAESAIHVDDHNAGQVDTAAAPETAKTEE